MFLFALYMLREDTLLSSFPLHFPSCFPFSVMCSKPGFILCPMYMDVPSVLCVKFIHVITKRFSTTF
jgi:hypothetical protein